MSDTKASAFGVIPALDRAADYLPILDMSAAAGSNDRNKLITPDSLFASVGLISFRDTSAAFDVTMGFTSSTPLTAGRSITWDVKNTSHELKFTAASVVTFPAGTNTLLGSGVSNTITLGTNSVTPVSALLLQNTTAAISGTQSASPSIILSGQAFKTGVGSQDTAWRIYNLPIQGAALDTSLMFGYSVNGGAYTDQMRLCGPDTVRYQGLAFRTNFNLIPSLASENTRFTFEPAAAYFTYANITKYAFESSLFSLADAVNIATNATTGTKICTATTQKIAFWNAAPVTQPAHIADPSGGVVIDAEARTAINSILAWQATLGLTAAA